MTQAKPLFESATCFRCSGSGSYSFNLMHGSTCYGCNGTGWKLTKRGAMANKLLQDSLSVPVETLKVGDLVRWSGMTKFRPLVRVIVGPMKANGMAYNPANPDEIGVNLMIEGNNSFTTRPGYMMRKGWSAEEKAPLIAAALAYQESLTQQGQPRKK